MVAAIVNLLASVGSTLPVTVRHALARVIDGQPCIDAGNGEYHPVVIGVEGGVLYWRQNGRVQVDPADIIGPCAGVRVRVPLRLVAVVQTDLCDDLASRAMATVIEIRDAAPVVRAGAGALSVTMRDVSFSIDEIREFRVMPLHRHVLVIDTIVEVVGEEACLAVCEAVPVTPSGPCPPCAAGAVRNSDSSYTASVASGGTLVLPDVTHTDSDGSPVTLPGMEPFVATPCGPGDDAHVLINQKPVIDLGPGETWDLHVEYPDGTQVGSWNAGAERWEIPACPACDDATAVVKNTAGTTLDTEAIPSGGTEDIIIGDVVITIEDTASTVINVANAPSGEPYTVVAPDAKYQLKDSAGVNIGSPGLIVSNGDANITAPDATYQLKDSAGTNIGGPGAIVSNGSANITAPDGTVKTTDGVTTVAAVKSNGTANLPQSVIKYKDAANADQITAASNTEYSGGTLRPATQVPRRALTLDGTPTGDYVTVADLIANTVPDVTSTPAVRAITASWAAGDGETIPVALPAEYQGITYAYVSNTGSNGTITVSVDGGSTFAAPPFTVGASGVAFRRTTYSGAGSVLYEE